MAVKVYTLSDKDYQSFPTGMGTVDEAVYVLPQDNSMNGGFVRLKKGQALKNWPYWYDEACYVVQGKGKLTYSTVPFTDKPTVKDLQPGDAFFISKANIVSFEGASDEPLVVLYIAVPNPV